MKSYRMTWYATMIVVAFIGMFPMSSQAGSSDDAVRLDLAAMIDEAVQRNPNIEAAQHDTQRAKERIVQAESLDDPEFKVQVWDTPQSFDVTQSARTIFGIGQRFPFPGKLRLRGEVAEWETEGAGHRVSAVERQVVASVKKAYYDLFLTYKAIDIHHEQVRLLTQFFEIANAKFRTGTESQANVLKAQVELSSVFQELPVLEQQQDTARAALNTLRDRDPDAPLGVPGEPDRHLPEGVTLTTLDQILEDAVQHRPEMLEAKAVIHQKESARTLARKQYYPDVRVEFQRWLNLDQRDGFGGNVSVNIPFAFWTKPKYDAGVRETLAAEQAARTRHRSLRNVTVFQVKDFWVKLQASQQVADLFSTTVLPQAEQNLTASIAGYRTGNVGFLDVIDAARNVEDFRLSYYRALVEREQHLAALEQVIGRELSR